MKKHITPEINAAFIAAGCLPMMTDTSDMDYYHSGADIYLRYLPKLDGQKYAPQKNLTEIVVVTNFEISEPSISHDISSEIINLHDLQAFLRFRESGFECKSHRSVRKTYEIALDHFEEAHFNLKRSAKASRIAQTKASIAIELLERAHSVQLEAAAAFFAHKPPPFRNVKQMPKKQRTHAPAYNSL